MTLYTVLERLTDVLAGSATHTSAFDKPISIGETLLIPVSRVAYGLGGGFGVATTRDGNGRVERSPKGESGGGGMLITPVGVMVVHRNQIRFIPIRRTSPLVAWARGVVFAMLIGALVRQRQNIARNTQKECS